MNPVTTTTQRRTILRAIDHAEARMLPAGRDSGLEHQFGATLTDARATAPLLIDVAQPDTTDTTDTSDSADRKPCAPGQCDQHNRACANHCRYREAAQALGLQRQHMPGEATRREQLNSLTKWLLVAGICAALALIWAASI